MPGNILNIVSEEAFEKNFGAFLEEQRTQTALMGGILRQLDTSGSEEIPPINMPQTIQKIVRLGQAGKVFDTNTSKIITNHGKFGKIVWDVIGIDHDTPANPELTHSMTLLMHDLILPTSAFDAAEPTNPDANRKSYGCNRWDLSNIRQWANSNGDVGTWFVPQSEYDVKPSYASTMDGFLKGLEPEFLDVLGKVKKTTALPNVDGGGSIETEDLFFLLSKTEVNGGLENGIAEGVVYPYFADNSELSNAGEGADANRIKYKDGKAQTWWLRSPGAGFSYGARCVPTSGAVGNVTACTALGVALACCIV